MKEVSALLLMLLLLILLLAPSFKTPQTAPQLNAVLHFPDQRPTNIANIPRANACSFPPHRRGGTAATLLHAEAHSRVPSRPAERLRESLQDGNDAMSNHGIH